MAPRRRRDSREAPALRAYREWIAHRYDPGYFTGGCLPPFMRATDFNRRGRRLFGLSLLLQGIVMLPVFLLLAEPGAQRLAAVPHPMMAIAGGLRLRSGGRPPDLDGDYS